MKEQLLRLARRIRDEFTELAQVVDRVQKGWQQAQLSSDSLYLDSVALNLHGFYAGLERLFELIGATVDRSVPQGANWHQMLLEQMTAEIANIRPAAISENSRDALEEYRGFRHIVRNIYSYKFDPVKVQHLVERIPGVFEQVRSELLSFADFLEQQAKTVEDERR